MHDACTKVKLFSDHYYTLENKYYIISLSNNLNMSVNYYYLFDLSRINTNIHVRFRIKFQLFYFAGISIPIFTMKIFYIPRGYTYI